ncbi:MAG: DUF2815 family protein [Actinomycetaceae bacterium]|nr:DUF2815 family protein [Actinomycetaceae bacterium]
MSRITIKNVRLSYAHLFEPYTAGEGDPKYSAALLIDKNDAETVKRIAEAIKAAERAGVEKFGSRWKANRNPLRDGDAEDKGPAYVGKFFMNARSNTAPSVVDRRVKKITDPAEVYSGCYANVSVEFYPYSASGNNGIACGLGNVQKIRDGEPLDGRVDASDEFEVLEDETPDLGGLLD